MGLWFYFAGLNGKTVNIDIMRGLTYMIVSLLVFASCIDGDFSVGSNLVEVKGRSILYEECTVEVETQLGDSAVTSGLGRIFHGRYVSSDFGAITSHAYFDFMPPGYSRNHFGTEANVEVKLDSICLILKYDNFLYGDSVPTQTMNVYRLRELLELDDKGQLYTTSSVPAETDPWVSARFNRPTEIAENDSIVEFRLPDAFGLELIELMHEYSDVLDGQDLFHTYFRGIKLSPEATDNAAVNTFTVNDEYPFIRLYYTTIGAITTEENTIDMKSNTGTAFSQIETDRSDTPLHLLNRLTTTVPSGETGNRVFLQGLTGLYAKLTFPDLNEILKLGDYVFISGAYLYIYPSQGTYGDFNPLPASISLNYLDESGKPQDIYVDPTTTMVQSGALVEDVIYNRHYYSFDITSYLDYELGAIGMYKSSLQLSLNETDMNSTLKSLVLDDASFDNEDNRIKLILYLIIYDND